ncbi:MAG: CHAT domain-containing protein [Bacteroidetes bacterium]|nr:CHAT domain-containing protein [Bacteroidota bacterium]
MSDTRSILLILLAFLCFEGSLSAQHPVTFTAYHDPEIRELFRVADSLRWEENGMVSNQVLDSLSSSGQLTAKQKIYSDLIRSYNYSLIDDGLDNKSKKIYDRLAEHIEEEVNLKYDYYFGKGIYFHSLDSILYDSAFINYKLCQQQFEKIEYDTLYYAALINRIGEVYRYGFNDMANARKFLGESLELRKKYLNPLDFDLGISYYNQSVIERRSGEYLLAEAYAKRALEISQSHDHTRFVLLCYNLLANALEMQYKLDAAVELHKTQIAMGKQSNQSLRWLKYAYGNLAGLYIDNGYYMEGLTTIQDLLNQFKSGSSESSILGSQLTYYLAICYQHLEKSELAESLFKESIKISTKDKTYPNVDSAFPHHYYAEFKKDRKKYNEALSQAEKALKILANLWESNNDEEALINSLLPTELLGDIYYSKGDLDSAIFYYIMADSIFQFVSNSISFNESKIDLASELRPVYEKIAICYRKNEKYSASFGLNNIFRTAEKTKYQVLEQRLKDKQHYHASTNDSLSLEIFKLQVEVDNLNAAYTKSKNLDGEALITANSLKEQIKALKTHNTPVNNSSKLALSVSSLQKSILEDEAVLEMFQADGNMFYFLVTSDTFFLTDFLLDSLYLASAKTFYNELSGNDLKNPKTEQLKNYIYHSTKVFYPFREAFAQLKESGKDIQKMIVIPDGIFNYIPFECLLSASDESEIGFKDLDYLIYQYEISYVLSSLLFIEQRNNETNDRNRIRLLALGPKSSAFIGNAEKESELTSGLFRDSRWANYQQPDILRSLADRFNVIHLACHADIDSNNYKLNRLRFGNLEEDSLMIYNYQLGMLEMDADLLVLNACETSKGEELKGEGIYSFTQSLMLSGVRSVLSSLWKIDDQTSTQLTHLFYKNLKKGNSIKSALNTAKIDYLKTCHPERAHPYFWAYLTANGNSEMSFKTSSVVPTKKAALTGLLLFGFLGMIFLFFLKKNK